MSRSAPALRTPASSTRLYFPLSLKSALLVGLTLTLPCILLAFLTGALFITLPPPLAAFVSASTWVGGREVSNIQLLCLGSLCLSFLLGLILADVLVITPAKRTLSLLLRLREGGFHSVPVLPPLGSDEIGEIGRQTGYATLEFGRMGEKSDESLEQRSLFLTTAAHQLRTPLSELLWAISDLRSERTPPEEKDQLLSAVDGTLRRMRLIIEHLLSGAGVEEGKFGYVFKLIDVVPLVKRLVEEFKPLSERQKVPVVFESADAFKVYADEERISLVLFDLISNAITYTPEGGNVIVSLRPAGERLEVSVADTGIGISGSERSLLFNKFYRSERARHMHPDGTGLGLYLAKTILEKHGSPILIDSHEGKGTKVTFYLHTKRENIPR